MVSDTSKMPLSGASPMLAASSKDGDPQAELARMKREFLVAQQRRRERSPNAAAGPHDTDDGPVQAGPADDDAPAGIAAVRP